MATETRCNCSLTAQDIREKVPNGSGFPSVSRFRYTAARMMLIPAAFKLDTLFLAMPFSWKGTIVQYAGRIHREHPGKLEVRVHDYVDANVPKLLRMHKKRLRGFRDIGYMAD